MITAFIKGQAIETAESVIVAESLNYLKAQFVFITSDWNGLEKTAYFTQGETTHSIKLDENNITVDYLHLSAGEWAVSVVGRDYKNGELVERITTDTATIKVKPFKTGAETPFPEPTPTEIEALKAEMGNLPDLATNDKTSLVNAINELYRKGGSNGGDNGTDGFSPIVDIAEIEGGHRVTITDAEGEKTFDVLDGEPYVLTESDKEEIKNAVLDEIPEGGNVDLSEYAKTEDIPTKTSELENDSGFITAEDIPETPAATDEQVKNAVDEYLAENPVGSDDFTLKEEFNNPHKYPNAQPTANLINPDNVTNGYYVAEATGKIGANATHCVTDYIPVKPLTNYIGKNTNSRIVWYDADKNFISGTKGQLKGASPENAKYLRLSAPITAFDDYMIVEGSVYPLKFIPYKTKLPWLTPELPEMKAYDFAVDGATPTVNLFNRYALSTNYYVDETNGQALVAEGHSATDFIKCKANIILKGNDNVRIGFYDKDYRFISGARLENNSGYLTTTPENTEFIRMSVPNNHIETAMVVEGDTIPQIYVPYGVTIPWLHTETKISKYHGKKMVCLGDSITYGGYNTVIAEDTGIETINAGFPSARYAYKESVGVKNYFSLHNIIDAICTGDWSIPEQIIGVEGYTGQANQLEKLKAIDFNTVDFVSFAYGTNDFGSATPYADSDNLYDINTVSGAVRYAIKTLLTKYPHIRIIVSLPIYRFFTDENNVVIEDSETKDFGGGTIPQYCEAIKKAAQDMKIPVVDMYNDGGINEFNRLNYFNITDGTHPNAKGSAIIGHGIAEGVLRYL